MLTKEDIEAFEYYNQEDSNMSGPRQTPLDMVKEYHKEAGQNTGWKDVVSQINMISEEFDEFVEIWDEYWEEFNTEGNESKAVEVLKELSDLIYVLYGLARANGWDLDEAVRRIHKNNVGRMYQSDGTIKRREDGKVVKNPDYPKPDLSDLV